MQITKIIPEVDNSKYSVLARRCLLTKKHKYVITLTKIKFPEFFCWSSYINVSTVDIHKWPKDDSTVPFSVCWCHSLQKQFTIIKGPSSVSAVSLVKSKMFTCKVSLPVFQLIQHSLTAENIKLKRWTTKWHISVVKQNLHLCNSSDAVSKPKGDKTNKKKSEIQINFDQLNFYLRLVMLIICNKIVVKCMNSLVDPTEYAIKKYLYQTPKKEFLR